MRAKYEPASLPQVDLVEIVDVSRCDRSADGFFAAAASSPCAQLSRNDGEAATALWRTLPLGEPMRCHLPPYLIRFHRGGALVLEASLCWRCNNASGRTNSGERFGFAFDGKSDPARELLALLRRVLPASRDQE